MSTFQNAPVPQHTFDSGSATTFQDAPAPQHDFNPLSTTAFKSAPASQHTSMSFYATAFQQNPPPQNTYNPSATTLRNTPAPQWPLPDVPASYPVVSDDPVTVHSEQYNPWELLEHFDNLLRNLVREVNSPGYQIPVDSRSRFTGAIRETHAIEAVELRKRIPSMNGICAYQQPCLAKPYTSPIPEGQMLSKQSLPMSYLRNQAPYSGNHISDLYTPNSPAASNYQDPFPGPDSPRFDPMAAPGAIRASRRGRSHSNAMSLSAKNHQILWSGSRDEEEQPPTKRTKHDTEETSESEAGIEFEPSHSETAPLLNIQAQRVPQRMCAAGSQYSPPQSPQLRKPDVVDDLLKLWTTVR